MQTTTYSAILAPGIQILVTIDSEASDLEVRRALRAERVRRALPAGRYRVTVEGAAHGTMSL